MVKFAKYLKIHSFNWLSADKGYTFVALKDEIVEK